MPAANPLTVVDDELPVAVTAPGLRVKVHVPAGKPVNSTDPVARAQVVCVMVPATGADGNAFGAATPLPASLVQPFSVVVTV